MYPLIEGYDGSRDDYVEREEEESKCYEGRKDDLRRIKRELVN